MVGINSLEQQLSEEEFQSVLVDLGMQAASKAKAHGVQLEDLLTVIKDSLTGYLDYSNPLSRLTESQLQLLNVAASFDYSGHWLSHVSEVLQIDQHNASRLRSRAFSKLGAEDIFAAISLALQHHHLQLSKLIGENVACLEASSNLLPPEKELLVTLYDCAVEGGSGNYRHFARKQGFSYGFVRRTICHVYDYLDYISNKAQLAVVAFYLKATSSSGLTPKSSV